MNDEQLSALLDDELPSEATRAAVAELLAESEARNTWGRYHLIGDALRAAELKAASTPQSRPSNDNVVPFQKPASTPKPERKPISRTGLGLAAAAALAAIALIVAAPAPHSDGIAASVATTVGHNVAGGSALNKPGTQLVANEVEDAGIEAMAASTVSQNRMIQEDEAQKRMSIYLINFNEQRARQSAPGTHPYVHIVGYDTP